MLKIITYGSLFLSLMLLSSCWTIPIQTDTPDEFTQSRDSLVSLSGSTSEEVVNSIGLPAWIVQKDKDEKTYYIYQWWSNDTDWMWVGYLPSPIVFSEKASESHCILLEFGNDKRLRSYKVDSDSGNLYDGGITDNCLEVFGMQKFALSSDEIRKHEEERSVETRKRAEEGDAKAMYRIYLGMRDDYKKPIDAWIWLCNAADRGYEGAQIEIAYWHRESNWELTQSDRIEWLRNAKIQADDRIAYLWYTLAANGDENRLRIRDYLFSETLSKKEIAEAEDMVSNWKPGQCQSGFMAVTSEQ